MPRCPFTSEELASFTGSFLAAPAAKTGPKLTIVTPSYNQAAFLERTILSVLNQGYANLEYIVVDGGSTDGSVDIIRKYEKHLAWWVSEKDGGQSDALNKGFARATGEIVGWQNSDDLYLPGAFDRAVSAFAGDPRAEVVFGNRADIDSSGAITGESRFVPFSSIVYQYEGISFGTQALFWKRDLFDRFGLMDTGLHLAMDYEFFMRAALAGCRFLRVPEYLGAMRRHPAAKTERFLGTSPHDKELDLIAVRYNRQKWFNYPLKAYALAYRGFNYMLQGDADYLFRGIVRRFSGG